jgi:cobalt-zinc-cadmium resistance protein CzcA
MFLGNARGALIVALTIPFSLLSASICLDLRNIPANLLSLGALDFGMVVDGAVVMVENIVRVIGHQHDETKSLSEGIREAAHEVQRPLWSTSTSFACTAIPSLMRPPRAPSFAFVPS